MVSVRFLPIFALKYNTLSLNNDVIVKVSCVKYPFAFYTFHTWSCVNYFLAAVQQIEFTGSDFNLIIWHFIVLLFILKLLWFIIILVILLIIELIDINYAIREPFDSCNWRLVSGHQVLIGYRASLMIMSEEMSRIVFLILHSYSCSLNGTYFLKSALSSISHEHWRDVLMVVNWPVQIESVVLILLTNLRAGHILICFLVLDWIRIDNVTSPANSDHTLIVIVKSWNVLIMWHVSILDPVHCILDRRAIN